MNCKLVTVNIVTRDDSISVPSSDLLKSFCHGIGRKPRPRWQSGHHWTGVEQTV